MKIRANGQSEGLFLKFGRIFWERNKGKYPLVQLVGRTTVKATTFLLRSRITKHCTIWGQAWRL